MFGRKVHTRQKEICPLKYILTEGRVTSTFSNFNEQKEITDPRFRTDLLRDVDLMYMY